MLPRSTRSTPTDTLDTFMHTSCTSHCIDAFLLFGLLLPALAHVTLRVPARLYTSAHTHPARPIASMHSFCLVYCSLPLRM